MDIVNFLITIATITLMVSFNALYVAGEFSTVASRKTRVSQMAANNNLARQLLEIMENSVSLDRYVAACQLGITVSSLVLGLYGQNVLAGRLTPTLESLATSLTEQGVNVGGLANAADSISATLILILLTILQVVMGELVPKSIAIQYPETTARAVVIPVKWSIRIFSPLIWLFNGSGNLILRLLKVDHHDGHSSVHSPAEIEILVTESHEGGLLDDEERQMLRNAFRLRDLSAKQVMVHRTRIISAHKETSVNDLIRVALDAGHTRIPIYDESIDDIVGFVHLKDLFRLYVAKKTAINGIMREVIHIPATMPIADLWERLKNERRYLAIVFDEYGGTAGMITFEDLIEEVFGEVLDEFDDEMALMTIDDQDNRIYLRGDLLISDVNEYLDLSLPEDTADTLSGLIFSQLRRAPQVGDDVEIADTLNIRVEKMEGLGVSEVSLQIAPTAELPRIDEWEVGDDE